MSRGRALLRLAVTAGVAAAGVAAGHAHQRTRPWGTSYWRAQCQLALALHDEPKLLALQAQMPPRKSNPLEQLLKVTARLVEPRTRHT
jgi:hypothetical protein